MPTWSIPAAISVATDRTAAWFNAIMDCFSVLDQHVHSGADGDGATISMPAMTPGLCLLPIDSDNVPSSQVTGGLLGATRIAYTGSALSYEYFRLYLTPGVYKLKINYAMSTPSGQASLVFGGVNRILYGSATQVEYTYTIESAAVTAGYIIKLTSGYIDVNFYALAKVS